MYPVSGLRSEGFDPNRILIKPQAVRMGGRVLPKHVPQVFEDNLWIHAGKPLQVNVLGCPVGRLRQRLQDRRPFHQVVFPVGRQTEPVEEPLAHITVPHIVQ